MIQNREICKGPFSLIQGKEKKKKRKEMLTELWSWQWKWGGGGGRKQKPKNNSRSGRSSVNKAWWLISGGSFREGGSQYMAIWLGQTNRWKVTKWHRGCRRNRNKVHVGQWGKSEFNFNDAENEMSAKFHADLFKRNGEGITGLLWGSPGW